MFDLRHIISHVRFWVSLKLIKMMNDNSWFSSADEFKKLTNLKNALSVEEDFVLNSLYYYN